MSSQMVAPGIRGLGRKAGAGGKRGRGLGAGGRHREGQKREA